MSSKSDSNIGATCALILSGCTGGIVLYIGTVFLMTMAAAVGAGVTISMYYEWFVIPFRDGWLMGTAPAIAEALPNYINVGHSVLLSMSVSTFLMPVMAGIRGLSTSTMSLTKSSSTESVTKITMSLGAWPLTIIGGFIVRSIVLHSFITPIIFQLP